LYNVVHSILYKSDFSVFSMAPRTTGARFRLGDPLDSDLTDFCAANWDCSATSVIRDAVRAYIDAQLADNEGMQQRYAEARRKRIAKQGD
jgi:hypothetical protein